MITPKSLSSSLTFNTIPLFHTKTARVVTLMSADFIMLFCCNFQSKKRGLSVDEKRTRMMEFFYEKVSSNLDNCDV